MLALIFITSNTVGALPLLICIALKSAGDKSAAAGIAADPVNLGLHGVDNNVALVCILFPFIISLVAFIILLKPLHGKGIRTVINGTNTFRWNRFFISAMVWIILSVIYLIIELWLDPGNYRMTAVTGKFIILVLSALLLIPFQAAFEEILFRGYLMQGFSLILRNRLFPLLMTSVLFGLMHALNPEVKEFGFLTMMPQYILFGLLFGIITILDDGIEAAMGAHAANNAFLCIVVTNKSSALQTNALFEQGNIYPWGDFAVMLVMGTVVILILKALFKWGSFSLLTGGVTGHGEGYHVP